MKKFLYALAAFFIVAPLYANDTAGIIMPTGDIEFKRQDGIALLSEALYIKQGRVEVNYIFKNTTFADITEQVFFPLPEFSAVQDFMGYDSHSHNFNFKCFVNGKEQPVTETFRVIAQDVDYNAKEWPRPVLSQTDITEDFKALYPNYYQIPSYSDVNAFVETLPKEKTEELKNLNIIELGPLSDADEDKHGWAPKGNWIKNVNFYWSQTFPAGKEVHIKHTYTPTAYMNSVARPNSECTYKNTSDEVENSVNQFLKGTKGAYDYLRYILKTANNWQTPIASFNLLVEGPAKSLGCFEGKPFYSIGKYYAANLTNFSPSDNLEADFVLPYEKDDFVPQNYTFKKNAEAKGSCGTGQANIVFKKGETVTVDAIWEKAEDNLGCYSVQQEHTGGWVLISDMEDFIPQYGKGAAPNNFNPVVFKIDGPANIRATPKGKISASLENGVYVWALDYKDGWYFIARNSLRGWTIKDNLIPLTVN